MMKRSIMKTEFQNLDELKDRLNLLRQNHSEKMAKAFEITIHPFIDGNGRTARLLMNLILLQNGFPIAILKGDTENRLNYYGALETAQTENNKQPFLDLITENVRETMERIVKVSGK